MRRGLLLLWFCGVVLVPVARADAPPAAQTSNAQPLGDFQSITLSVHPGGPWGDAVCDTLSLRFTWDTQKRRWSADMCLRDWQQKHAAVFKLVKRRGAVGPKLTQRLQAASDNITLDDAPLPEADDAGNSYLLVVRSPQVTDRYPVRTAGWVGQVSHHPTRLVANYTDALQAVADELLKDLHQADDDVHMKALKSEIQETTRKACTANPTPPECAAAP